MRHRIRGNRLGRKADHRNALLRNLATSLILHGHVVTTTAKAKALKGYVEPLITRVKRSSDMNAIKFLAGELYSEEASRQFLIRARALEGSSGWLSLIKKGFRVGDAAEVTRIGFVR